MRDDTTTLAILSADDLAASVGELGSLLHACVHDGASVGFVLPFERSEAEAFWTEAVLPSVTAGTRVLWAARRAGRLVGSVQLDVDTPPNQPHRAEVRKLLVHPEARRRGIARALMTEVEQHARQSGRSLLTLDTRTGDTAEPLYASLGFETVGVIPGWCRDTLSDRLDATTIMYKAL